MVYGDKYKIKDGFHDIGAQKKATNYKGDVSGVFAKTDCGNKRKGKV